MDIQHASIDALALLQTIILGASAWWLKETGQRLKEIEAKLAEHATELAVHRERLTNLTGG